MYRKCLGVKNAAHVDKRNGETIEIRPEAGDSPDPITEVETTRHYQKLDKKGHEIKELDYNVSAREFPKVPEAPQKEQLSEPTEYEQAVQTFE
mgnify:CR=1 FL=1